MIFRRHLFDLLPDDRGVEEPDLSSLCTEHSGRGACGSIIIGTVVLRKASGSGMRHSDKAIISPMGGICQDRICS